MGLKMSQPIKNKNGVWTTKIGVPMPLRKIIGKTALIKSLGTKDLEEALPRHAIYCAEFKTLIAQAKRILKNDEQLTAQVIDTIIHQWKVDTARNFYGNEAAINPYLNKLDGILEENNEPVKMVLDDLYHSMKKEQELQNSGQHLSDRAKAFQIKYYEKLESLVGGHFVKYLANFNVVADVHYSSQYRKLLRDFALAYMEITRSAVKQQVAINDMVAHNVDVTVLPSASTPTDDSQTFDEVWVEYQEALTQREPKKAAIRIRDYGSTINKFLRAYHERSIASFEKQDVARFRRLLERLPTRPAKEIKALSLEEQVRKVEELGLNTPSQNSVRKQMFAISAVFSYAEQQGYIKDNPAHGVTSDIKQNKRPSTHKGYTEAEIQQIFSSKLFHDGYAPEKADYGQAHYWLPLILYYTGARAEEIAQLYVDNIHFDEIPYIQITDERDDQSVKTGEHRQVPIYKHLLELGFREYVESLPTDGRLFPKLAKPRLGKYHLQVSRWYGKFIADELKIERPELKPFHAFRHTFITGCRLRDVREDVQRAITGHAQTNVASQYGSYPLEPMNKVIQAIPPVFTSKPSNEMD